MASTSAKALARSIADADGLQVAQLFNVTGWVAIVTGGGTGLGLTTAASLANNGARVYITGRRKEVLEEAARDLKPKQGGGELIAIQADCSTKEGVLKLKEEIESKEKYINLLVNNHGVSLPCAQINDAEQTPEGLFKTMFNDETMEHWLDCYQINTASYYFTSFAFLPLLAAAKTAGGSSEPGNIINISSMSGITKTSQRGQFSYNAGKAATISLSHQLATEFARRDIAVRVNVICPGYFPSGMTVIEPTDNQDTSEHQRKYRKEWGIPLARPGNAVDYAQCILSTATNRYLTGAEIVIDGGWLLESAF